MNCLTKRLTAFLLSLTVMLSLCINVSAATVYSVTVENNSVSFIVGSKNCGSYSSKDGSITLSALSDGRFLVCFMNTKGTMSRISIGAQTTLEISGTMPSLTLDKTLGDSRKVTLGASSDVTNMRINSTGATTIKGSVETLTVSSAVDVAVLSGASITTANLTSSSSTLTAASGSTVSTVSTVSGAKASGTGIKNKTSYTGSTSDSDSNTHSSGSYQVSSMTLSAKSGDRLDDLYYDLNSKLRVYDKNNRRIYGTAEWTSSGSTSVKNNSTYSYTFHPDSSSYSSFKDSVKVTIGSSSGSNDMTSETSIAVDVETITTSASSARLSDLTDELNDSVEAYSIKNQRVDGTASWVADDSISVVSGKSYRFVFTPDSSKYDTLRKSVKIILDGDEKKNSSSKNVTLKITSIDAEYDDRLSSLEDELEDNVRAYNKDGDRIDGEVEWVSDSTRVTKTGYHDFKFIPDSSKYDTVRDEIKVLVDGDSDSGSSGSSKVTLRCSVSRLYADYNDKLSEYLEELEDNVRAVDDSGDTVCGTLSWTDSSSTRLTRSGSYEYKFVPSKSKYKTAYGDIRIEVDD